MWKKNINTSKKILIISMGLINMNKCQRNKKMNQFRDQKYLLKK